MAMLNLFEMVLWGMLGLCLFGAVVLFSIFLHDALWYKKHPGAEERFAEIDDELRKKGL